MIVEMNRLLIVGPKRLLGVVVEEVQRLGSVQVDRVETEDTSRVTAMSLSEEEHQAVQTLERGVTRVDGILTLFPPTADAVPIELAKYASLTVVELDAQIGAVEQRVRDLTRKRLELEEEQNLIKTYEGAVRVLSPLLAALAHSKVFATVGFILNTKDFTAVAGLRNELEKVTDRRVEVVSRLVDERRIGVVVAFRHQDADAVRAVLTRAGVSELRLPSRFEQPTATETVALMERRKIEIPLELEAVNAGLKAIATSERPRMEAIKAALVDRLAQLSVIPEVAGSQFAFVIHGWAPGRDVPAIRSTLQRRFGADVLVYASPVDPHDDPGRVPVLLDNHPLIRPFQLLLSMFSPPRYDTWDPSPLFAITFPLFVGLVIGDVGYGLLFFALGWWLRGRARRGTPWTVPIFEATMDSPLQAAVSWLVRVIAFWIILFGIIYAEFFGNLPELLFRVHPLFDRIVEADLYFRLIVLVGIAMIYLGLLWHLALSSRHRNIAGILESLVILSATSALLIFLGTQAGMLPASIAPWSLYFVLAAFAGIVPALFLKEWMSPIWLLESFTAFGHVLSHARLMAFGLAGAALAVGANQLGPAMREQFGLPGGIIGSIIATLIAAVAQAFFVAFTIIGHFVQPARLHWVEFLTKVKYHDEVGREYQPFHKTGGG